jgi:4-hydroxyphenylacetate 3-monooxygenase
MRTGAEYREALRDGRKVFVMGEGRVDDVITHPATSAMVEQYVAWYDRHFDSAWADTLLSPPDASGKLVPRAFVLPKTSADVIAIGRAIQTTIFLSAGNITHTPLYGHLIALDVLTAAETRNAGAHYAANATAYRDMIASTGRFLIFCGGAPVIGQRMQPDATDRVSVKRVSENDKGMVVRGRLGMHTGPAYAGDIYVSALTGLEIDGHPVGFIVPVNAPGVTVLCRKVATSERDAFSAPLSARYDELDGQMWLDNVFIPWERMYAVDPEPEAIPRWLRWHHLRGWLATAEFTLGLALAVTDAMGLKQNDATVGYLVDLIAEVQIVRACLIAAEHDPEFTPTGYCVPNRAHLAAGGISLFKARQLMSELLRIIPGSPLVMAPVDSDLAMPELAVGLEETFGGGGFSARQRAVAARQGPCLVVA